DFRRQPLDPVAVRRVQECGAQRRPGLAVSAAAVVGADAEVAARLEAAVRIGPAGAEERHRLERRLERLTETRVLIRVASEGRRELERHAGREVILLLADAADVDARRDARAVDRQPATGDD